MSAWRRPRLKDGVCSCGRHVQILRTRKQSKHMTSGGEEERTDAELSSQALLLQRNWEELGHGATSNWT